MEGISPRELRSPAESCGGKAAMKVRPGARGDPVRLRQCQSDKSEWNRGVNVPRLLSENQEVGLLYLRRNDMWIGSLMASVCATVFSISWFVWPFVFVISPAWGIRDWVHDETCSAKPLLLAGLSLMIIIGGLLGYSA